MRVLEAHLVKRMIFTTASSIKGRGCCYLKKIIERDIKKDAAKKLAHIHSQRRRNEVINSLKGYCSHSKVKYYLIN